MLQFEILLYGECVSRLTDLIAQLKVRDSQLGLDLEKEIKVLSSRLPFGLNFERHSPELVQLPSKRIRKNDKVQIISEKGKLTKTDSQIWLVKNILNKDEKKIAVLESIGLDDIKNKECLIEGLVSVIEFKDKIYPGLISTGKVQNGGDKPFHTVINGENYHVLKALTFTHRGKIDAIYIDPPYNSGAKDWKYNNDYVETDDIYRHSKWLAMMERRLLIAKELLNPNDSVMIVTIDEKEYLRLGMLLEQTFPNAKIQMITSLINPKGVARDQEFYRVDEYIYFVFLGTASIEKLNDPMILTGKRNENIENDQNNQVKKVRWGNLLRSGTDAQRVDRKHQFYPIFLNKDSGKLYSIGEPLLPVTVDRKTIIPPEGTIAIWPIRKDGSEGRWQVGYKRFKELFDKGYASIGKFNGHERVSFSYLTDNVINQIESGIISILGRNEDNVVILGYSDPENSLENPKTMWNKTSHSASEHGSSLLRNILPGRSFPFPKSLYAVEDTLKFFINRKKNAIVLDFFSGSGTTAHAVMRLNKQDGGDRQCISVTNNEVSDKEEESLRKKYLRPGDSDWEKWGICEYITKPRIKAAITGLTPEGSPVQGDYKFNDEFPISDGLKENAEFFTLSYESALAVSHNIAFKQIAPLLWMRAGSRGRRIDEIPTAGLDIADTYALLIDIDLSEDFSQKVKKLPDIQIAYIVTDDERVFQSIAKKLPKRIEPVRLYESYLNNFSFTNGED